MSSRIHRRGVVLAAAVLAAGWIAAAPAAAEEPARLSTAQLHQRLRAATVIVLVNDHQAGTGFFVSADGDLITAAHVLGSADVRVEVVPDAGGRLDARLVAVDIGHDAALLRVALGETPRDYLPLAAQMPPPGERIYLFGSPIYRPPMLLSGSIATDRPHYAWYPGRYARVLPVAGMVQSGTSGGPWVNRRGEVVGLQSGTIREGNTPVGVAQVISVEPLRRLLETRKNAATPTMGAAVEELWQHRQDVLKRFPARTDALVLRQIQNDGPAARAGLKEWDAITKADGTPVARVAELLAIVLAKKPGETLALEILAPDGAGRREVPLTLGELEVNWPQATE